MLARWLLRECRVLLLDEPTRGVDIEAKAEIYRLIHTLAAGGLAVVLVSSELAELSGLCDRILVLADGRPTALLDAAGTRRTCWPTPCPRRGGRRPMSELVERIRNTVRYSARWAGALRRAAGGAPMSTDALDTGERAAEGPGPAARARRRIQLQEAALPVVVVALLVAGTIADRQQFLTRDNLLTVLTQASVVGVVAVGMTFVIATGGIDLSVGSMLAAAAIAGGLVGEQQSLPFMVGALGMGVLLGLVNGVAIAYGRIVPFIATLAMFAGARGLALWMSDKTPISLLQLDFVRELGRGGWPASPTPPSCSWR